MVFNDLVKHQKLLVKQYSWSTQKGSSGIQYGTWILMSLNRTRQTASRIINSLVAFWSVYTSAVLRCFWDGHVWFTCSHHRCQDAFCLVVRLDTGWIFFMWRALLTHGTTSFPPLASLYPHWRRCYLQQGIANTRASISRFAWFWFFIRVSARYSHCEHLKVMIMVWAGVPSIFHGFYKGSPFD